MKNPYVYEYVLVSVMFITLFAISIDNARHTAQIEKGNVRMADALDLIVERITMLDVLANAQALRLLKLEEDAISFAFEEPDVVERLLPNIVFFSDDIGTGPRIDYLEAEAEVDDSIYYWSFDDDTSYQLLLTDAKDVDWYDDEDDHMLPDGSNVLRLRMKED